MGLSSLTGFVLDLVSCDITSFKPIRHLGVLLGVLHRPLVCVSPGAFFLRTFATFLCLVMVLISGDSRSVLRSLFDT